jgi:UDP-galactopyranose mutase
MKSYKELPAYLAGWDLAFLPFARNESTRFISPTKTPEYLAAGKPVVSTSIRDVVRPYATERLVHIADTPEEFVKAAELAMHEAKDSGDWLKRVDSFLSTMSWDQTALRMARQELLAKQAKAEAAKLVRQVTTESRLGA